ncbi:MAG TPA: hypothetical protein VD994_01185, partial [Prosthecobacter sp.]|nr:hypothetical protein [Prosthecobacter sp.]
MFSFLKFLVAAGIATFGVWYVFQYDTINEVTGGVAFVCVLTAFVLLKWQPDLSKKEFIVRYKQLKWLPGEFTRHWLITGDTGVGKTTSGFNPLLHQISVSRPNWGGLILGAKGDEHFFAMEHFAGHGRPEAVCVLAVRPDRADRTWKPKERYNLVSDKRLPYTTHAKNLVDTGASLTEGEQSSFFKPA